MKLKKLVALSLMGAMAVSAFPISGSCEEQNTITFPLEETMEFTAVDLMNADALLGDATGWKAFCEMANISVDLTEVKQTDAKEKISLIMAGNDYPDFFFKVSAGDAYELGAEGEGILIPLEDLIREYAPNLTALLDELDGWKQIEEADGHVHVLPYIENQIIYGGAAPLWINQTWMDNLGLEMPKSMDELYQVLKAFKEQDANGNGDTDDEIPFTCSTNIYTPNRLLAYSEDGCHYYDIYCTLMDGEFVFYPYTEGFKNNYLAYLRDMYAEGILDQNAFTQNHEQMAVTSKSGDVVGMFMGAGAHLQVTEQYVTDYVTLMPFVEENYPLSHGISASGMQITDKCEHPEVLVAWMDYLYSEEGGRLAYLGIEGEHYEIQEDGTYITLQPEGISTTDWKNSYAIQGSAAAPMKTPALYLEPNAEQIPIDAWNREQTFKKVYQVNGTFLPALKYTAEENELLADKWTAIKEYLTTYTAQVATGQVDLDASWEEFQTNLKKMGADDVLAARKAAYERATAE